MRDEADERSSGVAPPLDLPDEHDGALAEPEAAKPPSLFDELGALIADGKTYAEAEIAFQKSRAAYVGDSAKGAVALGIGALAFIHLALIALAVGLVIALAPLIGAWGATGLVVGLLLAGAVVLGLRAKARVDAISAAFRENR